MFGTLERCSMCNDTGSCVSRGIRGVYRVLGMLRLPRFSGERLRSWAGEAGFGGDGL